MRRANKMDCYQCPNDEEPTGVPVSTSKQVSLNDSRRYAIPRDAWAPHTQTQRHGVLAMMIRPYKPRDSARSALLDCST